jgi:phosphosulfolactate phosphohydrolase-like enzyme
MIVLKATREQHVILDGYRNGHNVLKFAKDGNDNWIVGLQVLNDSAFEAIHDQLNELERIEYVPIIEEEE